MLFFKGQIVRYEQEVKRKQGVRQDFMSFQLHPTNIFRATTLSMRL